MISKIKPKGTLVTETLAGGTLPNNAKKFSRTQISKLKGFTEWPDKITGGKNPCQGI